MPPSLRPTFTALASTVAVFIIGNLLIFLLVIAPTITPAPVPEVSTAVNSVPTVLPEQSSIGVPPVTTSDGWRQQGNRVTQETTELRDYFRPTGVIGERYSLVVDITLPSVETAPDVGAGIVFHSSGHDTVANGELIRFHRNGAEILWGSYDDAGAFTFGGTAPVNATAGTPHRLTVTVHAGSFDVTVDDTVVTAGLPITGTSGWINLMTYGGAVTFDNFQLTVGG